MFVRRLIKLCELIQKLLGGGADTHVDIHTDFINLYHLLSRIK
jgi:hypothetical protein